jgi:putative mRNA 3-end processing factor
VLGSAQVRMEHGGRVWVASGDYKLDADGTCAPFEPVRCDTFITESTFGLPIYRWPAQAALWAEVNAWWQANAAEGRPSVLFCYAFGKAQRVLQGVDASIGPILVHGAVEPLNAAYRAAGVALPPTRHATDAGLDAATLRQALVLAPPSAQGTPWMRRFPRHADAFASGWMRLRGTRRRRGVDRGFVLSDHADWPGLQAAIAATGAGQVFVTHGSVAVMVRWLREQGLDAQAFRTEYGDEDEGPADAAAPADPPP